MEEQTQFQLQLRNLETQKAITLTANEHGEIYIPAGHFAPLPPPEKANSQDAAQITADIIEHLQQDAYLRRRLAQVLGIDPPG